jgi:uncharacterized protein (TIGR02265 family)
MVALLRSQAVLSNIRVASDPLLASSNGRSIDAADDWVDLAGRIESVPEDAKIRGMFLSEALRLAPRLVKSNIRTHYIPFSLYPVREYMRLLLRIARARYHSRPAASALLELGFGVYSQFAASMAGTAIFAMAQLDFKRVCELSPKAYSVTLKPGRTEVVHAALNDSVVKLREVWVYPDIFHAGIWLGAMEACGVTGSIEVIRHSLSDVDFHMKWQRK